MTPTRKTITGAAAVIIIGAATALALREPTKPPTVQPLTVWVCCSVNGCGEVDGPASCPASDDLVSCCGPSTNPDGTVSCGC